MKSFVYTPEHLGSQPIDMTTFSEPYQIGIFSYLTLGGISQAQGKHILPSTVAEAEDANRAISVCMNSIEAAIEAIEPETSVGVQDPKLSGLKLAISAYEPTVSYAPKGLFENSYMNSNSFTTYHPPSNGVRTVKSLPVGLRSYVGRFNTLVSRVQGVFQGESTGDFRRFETTESLRLAFPCLAIPDEKLDEFEHAVLVSVYGGEELPEIFTPKQADKIISLIGGGTLLNALDNTAQGEEPTQSEVRLRKLAKRTESILGRDSFRITALGRAAWGVNSIRLRTGDDIPKVTFPKPGV